MNVLGVIVEYNPFHNGHLYHLEESMKLLKATHSICVMSGNFIQRGEPSIVNKWARAKMALAAGVDLVIELPVVYAMSSAEFFAYGSVKILDSLNIVDSISFGSENGKLPELQKIADILADETFEYKTCLKSHLQKGLSFPEAREKSLEEVCKLTYRESDISSVIKSSNNILGIEYLKALKRLNSRIRPHTILRVKNDYNSQELTGDISSATSIRNYLKSNDSVCDLNKLPQFSCAVPKSTIDILQDEFSSGRGPIFSNTFDNMLLSFLRIMDLDRIKSLPYVSEGLENRIAKFSRLSGDFDELIDNLSTRRYTKTRLQRSLFSTFTGLTSKEFDNFNLWGGPQYIRVLGFNNKGKELLSVINKKASLPVIIKTADFKNSCNQLLNRMLEIECQATDLYVLGYKNKIYRKAGQDFTQNPVIY